jgi:hypothetical protein
VDTGHVIGPRSLYGDDLGGGIVIDPRSVVQHDGLYVSIGHILEDAAGQQVPAFQRFQGKSQAAPCGRVPLRRASFGLGPKQVGEKPLHRELLAATQLWQSNLWVGSGLTNPSPLFV